ncbi:hypothetical protein D3C85_1688420 [compost metagenome]
MRMLPGSTGMMVPATPTAMARPHRMVTISSAFMTLSLGVVRQQLASTTTALRERMAV